MRLALLLLAACSCPPHVETRTVVLPPRVGCLAKPIPPLVPFAVVKFTPDGGIPRCGASACEVGLGSESAEALAWDLEQYEQYSREAWAACAVKDGGP